MLQREVSDSTWKETNRRKQPLYQQMVAIDCGTAQQETNCHRNQKKNYIQHIVAGKDKGPLQSSNANFQQKKEKKIYNNKKENKNNNWAPSKIRLRLGAEVDKNYNNSKS